MQNKTIEDKIQKNERILIYSKTMSDLISELHITSKDISSSLPKSIARKIGKFHDDYKRALGNDKKEEKIKLAFEKYKNEQIYKYKKKASNAKNEIVRLSNLRKWNDLDEESKLNAKTDLTFYKANVLGYWLNLSVILFEVIYLIVMLSFMEKNYWIGIFILSNIAFLLFLFTSAIKIKNYIKTFAYMMIVFGAYIALRVCVVIPLLMNIPLFTSLSMTNKIWIFIANVYILGMSIFVGTYSLIKIRHKEKYLHDGKISYKQMSK